MNPSAAFALSAHASTPCPSVRAANANVRLLQEGLLQLDYSFEGNLHELAIPAPAEPQRADDLWRRTCFEAFIRADDSPAYLELNFSPSGEWAAYQFRAYREGMTPAELQDIPRTSWSQRPDRLEAHIQVPLNGLMTHMPQTRLKLALCMVIEDRHGQFSYWALAHPPGKPDFHHPAGFCADIPIRRSTPT